MTETIAPSTVANVITADYTIVIQNLTKRYPGRREAALDNLNLSIPSSQILGLIGANGAGKTTLLKIIATLISSSGGDVLVNNVSVRKKPQEVRRLIGYLPDDFGLYEEMRVGEYLEYFAACYGIQGKARSRLVNELLQLVDLGDRRKESLRGLSRGMKQRLGLARCLVNDPQILLLDEPANGLDPRARIELRELLRELSRMGKTIVLSSNILVDMNECCDTLAVLAGGKLTAHGPVSQISSQGESQKNRSVSIRVINQADLAKAYEAARAFPPVVEDSIEVDQAGLRLELTLVGDEPTCAALLSHLIASGVPIVHFGQTAARLEEIFLES